mgnify:FL=1
MKTKVILSQQMASAIIAAGQEEAQKNNWSVPLLLPMTAVICWR